MNIKCAHDQIVEIHKIVPNPKNPNSHSSEQIERLAKIIDFQGQRHPIIVSKRSGFVVAGHGRLEAIKALGWKKAAVNFQDFATDAEEYAFIVSDNAIAEWSDLDLLAIKDNLSALGESFTDLDLLGLQSVEALKDAIFEEGSEDDQGDLDQKQMTKCPNCGEVFDHADHKDS
jgi:ParB-like chromosome segregation protein Spo0J